MRAPLVALLNHPLSPVTTSPSLSPSSALTPLDEPHLRETLKRCSPATLEAALAFRATGDSAHLPAIITGVIERFVERSLREKLAPSADGPAASGDLRLIQDLGLDSLTMMEIVILTEDVLPVTINNDELRHLRTLGDLHVFLDCKLRGRPLPPTLLAQSNPACAATLPPFSVSPSPASPSSASSVSP